MSRRPRKRASVRTMHVDWCPSVAALFDLAGRLGWTPPTRAKVVLSRGKSTWSARFVDDNGQPVNTVVRLKHLPDGEAEVLADEIHVRFVATGAELREAGA
ncbi:hypothetical protein [Caulobacter soli]|uniref:hypothetical protein n=1 Tax=Caulobacter soli TaxID=2708539 RepID=UPI0013EDE3BB|nr:hypothetical protein [Caulobacter soli]